MQGIISSDRKRVTFSVYMDIWHVSFFFFLKREIACFN